MAITINHDKNQINIHALKDIQQRILNSEDGSYKVAIANKRVSTAPNQNKFNTH